MKHCKVCGERLSVEIEGNNLCDPCLRRGRMFILKVALAVITALILIKAL